MAVDLHHDEVAMRLPIGERSSSLVRLMLSGLLPRDPGLEALRCAATIAIELLVDVAEPGSELRVHIRKARQVVVVVRVQAQPTLVAGDTAGAFVDELSELCEWATASAADGAVSVAFGRNVERGESD